MVIPPRYESCGHGRDVDWVRCPACVLQDLDNAKLQNSEMLAVLTALADRVSVRFGEIIKYEPVATGRYLDAAYDVIRKAKTDKRDDVAPECRECGGPTVKSQAGAWVCDVGCQK
jgi:hypothetical protein